MFSRADCSKAALSPRCLCVVAGLSSGWRALLRSMSRPPWLDARAPFVVVRSEACWQAAELLRRVPVERHVALWSSCDAYDAWAANVSGCPAPSRRLRDASRRPVSTVHPRGARCSPGNSTAHARAHGAGLIETRADRLHRGGSRGISRPTRRRHFLPPGVGPRAFGGHDPVPRLAARVAFVLNRVDCAQSRS
jgi:hypothetical protein